MKKEMIKTSLILMIYTLVAGLALSVVYKLTEVRITEAEMENVIKSMELLLTDEKGSNLVSSEEIKRKVIEERKNAGKEIYTNGVGTVVSPVYEFKANHATYYVLVGYAVGYGGKVITMAAFEKNEDLRLRAIKVLDYSQETPGLGAKIAEDEVQQRFYPIPSSGLEKGLKVDKDAGKTVTDPEISKSEGVVKVSDVMTGATITPRAVANSINAMYEYLKKEYLK
uniref:Ion-translocating oxidoreductase complex subunit G n=1 Tax=Fervidobacterium thailandense TaxID=1008305 RepID=A0A7C5RJY7_9BACT